ncbi:AmmeMemoRadiSam system protein B [Haliovirga abyssi]|uniref:MEMO1 family protein HLVA_15020 n=1 Tax=Haliovirga abyssi TaxID=2996794 RepID=A0AAU9DFG0_9FUSO|nr:AmmeMemoRadiSam system protein B [Haliovirga abyssi]BDU50933.1 hypothetical protein HLVA_15020 [Haliovirga abyssi]
MKIRESVFAGKFYPDNKVDIDMLLDEIHKKEMKNIKIDLSKKDIIGGVVPHAGYIYSGYEAVHFFDIVGKSKRYDTIVIINPNHTGYGSELEADSNDKWKTPFGEVDVDIEFRDKLNINISDLGERYEHSGEVMVPYLQKYLDYDFKIVPICMGIQNFRNSSYLANELYKVKKELGREILIIASSDFTHFMTPKKGREMDQYVIDAIFEMDSLKIEREVRNRDISVCGFGLIMTLIEYSKLIGDEIKIELLKRGHSGEVIESDEVVDYVSMLFYM